eukprot:scaffold33341_cov43-Phaeocystis_antarctica.AAC.1
MSSSQLVQRRDGLLQKPARLGLGLGWKLSWATSALQWCLRMAMWFSGYLPVLGLGLGLGLGVRVRVRIAVRARASSLGTCLRRAAR